VPNEARRILATFRLDRTAPGADRQGGRCLLPENVENKYRFVTLAAKRASSADRRPARVAVGSRKNTVVAQQEVAAGLVELWNPAQDLPADAAAEEEEQE
jgi:DNA-directed RNA polymerase subunit K/omega